MHPFLRGQAAHHFSRRRIPGALGVFGCHRAHASMLGVLFFSVMLNHVNTTEYGYPKKIDPEKKDQITTKKDQMTRSYLNDVSYVTRINDEIHFAWQAQYLVSFKGDFTCSAHWK